MTIRFYSFEKKPNSTATPAGTGKPLQCQIYDPCSVLSPVIIVAREDPTGYNYAYIPKWSRWYFVQNWRYSEGRWLVELSVDVLATYASEIKTSSQYVSRAASGGNGGINDNLYPTYAHPSVSVQSVPSPWETGSAGTYVVGVLGGSGQTSFYALSQGQLDSLLSFIFSDSYADAIFGRGEWADVYPELKTQINPLQYISSITWYPINIGGTSHPIKVGWVNTTVSGNVISPKTTVTLDTVTLQSPNHPQGGAWSYLNAPPYSEYFLYYAPFGLLPLESAAMMRVSEITASVDIDPIAGVAFLTVRAGDQIILRTESNAGQRIQLGQITAPGTGVGSVIQGVAGAVSGGASIVGAALSGDIAGAVGSVANLVSGGVSAFRGVAENKIPSTSVVGSTSGGYPALVGNVLLISSFMPVVGKDPAHKGNPVCAVTDLGSVEGYVECYWPHLDLPGTEAETTRVYSLMERGFYIE